VTLGTAELELLIESAEGEESKRYIHHYSMPPYSSGETGRMGGPNRREIGHGALAERALFPVIPSEQEFPYTIRLVTEILSSNGSTSMASTCGSTLSLMDAGVPIKLPVAGIAMGIVVGDGKKYFVLTDIVGVEDGYGDMDFKVAGTKNGITALQLDVKTLMLTTPMLKDALDQAKKARMEILQVMLSAIDKPREKVSKYAPKILTIKIDPAKIGELIGPSGRTIKKIIAQTDAQINVDDDGTVTISAIDEDDVKRAIEIVEGITKDAEPGEIYEG
jgi:polyribonucleotide nucleotidyltransferase